MKRLLLVIATVVAASLATFGRPAPARADDATDGLRAYQAKRYVQAAALYRRAIERGDKRPETLYNYGTALLAADSMQSAVEVLERAAKSTSMEVRYRALFNLGLAHLRRGLAAPADSGEASLDAALETYKRALIMRSQDGDAKWNYELALRKKQEGGGGGGGGGGDDSNASESPSAAQEPQAQRPSGGIGQEQADQLLNSAAREERNVQGRKQRQSRAQPPPGGKDW